MMTQEQAAKYLIVAWVKDWSMRMYLDTVGGGRQSIQWQDAHNHFQWLPKDAGWFIRNTNVRRYIAEAMRKVNDRLWDAKDNAERMALADQIMNANCAITKQSVDSARMSQHAENRNYRNVIASNKVSVDAMRRGSGHAWNVCK